VGILLDLVECQEVIWEYLVDILVLVVDLLVLVVDMPVVDPRVEANTDHVMKLMMDVALRSDIASEHPTNYYFLLYLGKGTRTFHDDESCSCIYRMG